MQFNQEKFNKFILDNNVVGLFKEVVTLKSRRKSGWYVNWRNPLEDVYLTDVVSDFVLDFAEDNGLEVDTFYGVPEGATKLGVICTYKNATGSKIYKPGSHVLSMGRGKPKDHGLAKDRYFLGVPKGRTAIIEDVTTTGGSLLERIGQLKEAEVNVVAAIGLTNRMELTPILEMDDPDVIAKFMEIYKNATGQKYIKPMGVEQAVDNTGVKYFSMSDAIRLLPSVYKKLMPGTDIAKSIENEFVTFGVDKIDLGVER